MAQVTTEHGVTLCYETDGRPEDPPILLVAGFGAQLVSWPRGFCRALADGGRYVVSFDHRDCGLSSKFDGQGGSLQDVIAAASAGDAVAVGRLTAYTLSSMADDGFGLLDALGIQRAHVLGASMGGMVAQVMAIERPERLLTLISMASSSGDPDVGQSTPEALHALLSAPPPDRDGYIAAADATSVWRSKRYPDPSGARAIAAESYDRCYYPQGVARQLAAMIASGSRAEELAQLRVPTLVIHGLDDTLIAPSGGQRTAELIPDARLLLIDDMGHDRPEPLWPQLCTAILDHTA